MSQIEPRESLYTADIFSLTGKQILITGANGSFGRHFAKLFISNGAQLVLTARNTDALNQYCESEFNEDEKKRIDIAELDITDSTKVKQFFETYSRIDIIINNAGIASESAFLDESEAAWDKTLETNLKGAWLVAQAGSIKMAERNEGGKIINIASVVGMRPAGFVASYGVSKAALVHLTKSMAIELTRYNIQVNAISPGYIETNINRAFFATDAGQKLVKRIPQRHLGQLGSLSGPMLLLASAASDYMTGSVLVVDGGHLINSL